MCIQEVSPLVAPNPLKRLNIGNSVRVAWQRAKMMIGTRVSSVARCLASPTFHGAMAFLALLIALLAWLLR